MFHFENSMEKFDHLYIHFPYCAQLCNYCDFYKHEFKDSGQLEKFYQQLCQQFLKIKKDFGVINKDLKTVFIGGGTPSLWREVGGEHLKVFFKQFNLDFSKGYEFTIEANPKSLNKDSLWAWQEAGVNRVSLGVQSVDDRYLQHLNRNHRKTDLIKALQVLSESKINFSCDLILGLPYSEGRDLKKEIDFLLYYKPKHISTYILTVGSNYPHYANLPSEDQVAEEYQFVSNYLKERSFNHYEVSNFSQSGFESQHNLSYWKLKNVIPLGVSAVGFFRQGNQAKRLKWTDEKSYSIEELDSKKLALEEFYLHLRLCDGVKWKKYILLENQQKFLKLWSQWEERGFLSESSDEDILALSAKGFLMLGSIMNDIFSARIELMWR